jgi:hypothetical protein
MTTNDPDVAQIRQEIAQARADLGETVTALSAKTDIKARAAGQVRAWWHSVGRGVRRLARRGS